QQRCVPAEPGIVPTVEGRGEPFRLHRGVVGLLPAGAAAALALPAHGAPVRAEGGTVAADPASQRRHARPCDGPGPPPVRLPPGPGPPAGPEVLRGPSPSAASASSAVRGVARSSRFRPSALTPKISSARPPCDITAAAMRKPTATGI